MSINEVLQCCCPLYVRITNLRENRIEKWIETLFFYHAQWANCSLSSHDVFLLCLFGSLDPNLPFQFIFTFRSKNDRKFYKVASIAELFYFSWSSLLVLHIYFQDTKASSDKITVENNENFHAYTCLEDYRVIPHIYLISMPQDMFSYKQRGSHREASSPCSPCLPCLSFIYRLKTLDLWIYGYVGRWVYGYMDIWMYKGL